KEIGYNYRMSNVLAGIGRGQLRVLEQRVAARRQVFERYQQMLSDTQQLAWMPEAPFGRSTRWLTAGRIRGNDPGETRDTLLRHLAEQLIEARHVWKPMHRQPVFEGFPYYPHREDLSVSDRLFDEGLCLPSGSNLTIEQQERIV